MTKTKTSPTQGPWELIRAKYSMGDFIIRADKAPGGIALTVGGLGDEEEANARLIATAPELLGAAKYALSEDPGDWKSKLAFAIAKAEGGSPHD